MSEVDIRYIYSREEQYNVAESAEGDDFLQFT